MQITSLTPGFVMSVTEVMCAGLLFGTISTSVLVANCTGFSTSPFAYRAAGCFGLAAANTSAGAPCSMSVSSAPEQPNVYFAVASISGNTLFNDAAASTVATDPPPPGVVLAAAVLEVDAAGDVELELLLLLLLLLPQPTASADTAIVISPAETRRTEVAPINRTVSLSARQNPGTLTESWQ